MRAALAACLVALVATGCGGADGAGEFHHGRLSLTYPSTWTRDSHVEDENDLALYVEGPSGVAGVPIRLTLVDEPRESWTYRGFGKDLAYTRPVDLHGFLIKDRAFSFDGMHQAWRVDTNYQAKPKGGGPNVLARAIDIAWIDGDRELDLALSGPQDAMTDPAVQGIIASLRRDAPD